ncbi:hypothetical protein JCM6882_009556 [Rhodosporidiobolus microsporus]
MAPSSLAELQGLKYAELRTLCKESNLKATGKTDALVAQLAEHFGFPDENELADEPADEPAPAPPVKPAPKKRTASDSSKGKSRKASAQSEVQPEEEPVAAATPVKAQEKIVYMTSPGTKATVAALLSTVKDLQSQLTTACTSLSDLESTVAAPRSPALKKADVVSLIDRKIAEHRQAMSAELEKRFEGVAEQLAAVEENVEANKAAQDEGVETMRSQIIAELESVVATKDAIEKSVDSLRSDLTSRLSALETKPTASVLSAAPEAVASPRSRKVSFADPMDEDAPPTRSVSFSSPSSPAITPVQSSTPRRSSLAPVGSRKATPFKLTLPDAGSSSTPASSLPSHMLATAASAAKRSPRSPRASAPAAVQQVEPQSPAGPPPKPTIGKRARDSDASELSVELAALDSPVAEVARSRTTTDSSSGSSTANVVSPGRRLSEILASVSGSARKDDGHHARKRLRVSSGTIIDHGSDAEEEALPSEDEEGDEDFQDSFEGSEEQTETSFEEEGEEDDEVAEEDSVREYLVALKTGEEEPTAIKPAPRASSTGSVSVHDPSFFAAAPVSPARRATLDGPSSTKENTALPPLTAAAPSSARKSLPMASLPCPIVSPYAASKTPKVPSSASASAPNSVKKPTPAPAFSFGTPSTIANRRITIGPAASSASARKATPAARQAPYSATPAKRASTFSTGAGGSARKPTPSARGMATPPAARTLFGSERLTTAPPSSSGRSAATSTARTAYEAEEDEEDGDGESRFGDDGFASALTSPQKAGGGWGAMGVGAFGRA